MADEVKENFKYKYPGYLSNQETITSAKLNSIINAINTLTENLMNHDHLGQENANGETTRGPKLIGSESIEENSITNKCLADRTIESNKIADNAITTTKIALENITTALIQNEAITSEKLRNDAITRDKIVNGLITTEKIHESVFEDIFDMIYPIGSVYITLAEQETCPLEEIRGSWYPIAKGKVLQGANSLAELGNEISAGLPNITGSFETHTWKDFLGQRGAFNIYKENTQRRSIGTGGDYFSTWNDFDASKSNSIYGNSNTVQPPALLVNIFKRIEDHTKIIRIICNTPGATITITVNNQSQTFQNGEAYKEVYENDTYEYIISKDGYISESDHGIIHDNIYYETTLQLSYVDLKLYQPDVAVKENYSYYIKKTGIYKIKFGGGSSISGAYNYSPSLNNCAGGSGEIKLQLSSGSTLKLYSIKAGNINTTYNSSTISFTAGVGVGVKVNNEWLCVAGGAAAMRFIVRPPDQQIPAPRPWIFYFCTGGGYLGGTIDTGINVPYIAATSKGYNALDGQIGTGTANTDGSGFSATPSTNKHVYGGSGYLNPNYNYISSTMTSNDNSGDAYIYIEYQGQ